MDGGNARGHTDSLARSLARPPARLPARSSTGLSPSPHSHCTKSYDRSGRRRPWSRRTEQMVAAAAAARPVRVWLDGWLVAPASRPRPFVVGVMQL